MPIDTLIYDVGAHRGEDTEFYLNKGFSVVAIEAVPEFCDELNQRFKEFIITQQLIVLNVAISLDTIGKVDFYVDDKIGIWGTTNLDWVNRNRARGRVRKIKVKSSSLIDIMKRYGVPRYCKIDIEGNDLDALKSLKRNTNMPNFISIEAETKDWYKLLEEFTVFRDLGYRKYKIIDQNLIPLQICSQVPCEGKYFDHRFQYGSSGLFGNELPGKWLDMSDAIETFKNVFRGYALNAENGFLRRSSVFNLLGYIDVGISRLRGLKSQVHPARILPPPGWYDTHAMR